MLVAKTKIFSWKTSSGWEGGGHLESGKQVFVISVWMITGHLRICGIVDDTVRFFDCAPDMIYECWQVLSPLPKRD